MKNSLFTWTLLLLFQFIFYNSIFAQPDNDRCVNATPLIVGADSESCEIVLGDTRGAEDATALVGPPVCSFTWVADDVWFSLDTDATTPPFGITVEVRLDQSNASELIDVGMAIYNACEEMSVPIACFNNEQGRRTIQFPSQCLDPNSSYLVRVWSAPEANANAGTFSICAYASSEDPPVVEPVNRIIYEETFNDGLNGWISVAETETADMNGEILPDDWVWYDTGCIESFLIDPMCIVKLSRSCEEIGVVGFPADWYQTNRTGDTSGLGNGPYPDKISSLVSPPIDLSKEGCVNLTWTELHVGLNGSFESDTGPTVQYSLDDGETWIDPSQAIRSADVSGDYGGEYLANTLYPTTDRVIPLLGAGGNTSVRLRFRFVGDFYFWLIDDVRIVEGETNDIVAQSNFYARSPINPMSIHQIDQFDFLIDVANLACEEQTNVNVNLSCVNGAGVEVHNVDLPYGTISSDSLAENQSFLQPFTPTEEVDNYSFTYTLTSDIDNNLENNIQSFDLNVVNETVFRKEDGNSTGTITPNTAPNAFWADGEAFAWEMGNIFYAPNAMSLGGDQLRFNELSFQIGNPADLINELLVVWLYKIEDSDFDGIISKEVGNPELTRLGISEYRVTGLEDGLVTVPLSPYNGDDFLHELNIESGTHYMATVEFQTTKTDGTIMTMATNDSYDYAAAIFNARQSANGDLTKIRYAHSFAITKEGYFRISPSTTGDLTTGNFSEDLTPLIRLGYEELIDIATYEVLNNTEINILPNPVRDHLVFNLIMEESENVKVSIFNLNGQLLETKEFEMIDQLTEGFDLSELSNGIYMLSVETDQGVKTKKFIVSK